jgi:aldehyde dehydrogenase (NAD+)
VVDAAVAAARAAFETGPWSKYTAAQRAQCLNKFADLIETKAEEIGKIEAASIGQPSSSAKMLTAACAATYRYYAGWADKIPGESYKEEDGTYKILQYEPFGVCAGIAAWYVSSTIHDLDQHSNKH